VVTWAKAGVASARAATANNGRMTKDISTLQSSKARAANPPCLDEFNLARENGASADISRYNCDPLCSFHGTLVMAPLFGPPLSGAGDCGNTPRLYFWPRQTTRCWQ
jgi:hypothetical protein